MYQYKAKVVRVVDPDTYDLQIDLGFNIFTNHRVRLMGIDAPETKLIRGADEAEVAKGKEIKAIMTNMLEGKVVTINSVIDKREDETSDKYGRFLVDIYLHLDNGSTQWVNQYMREKGYIR
jgi:micrococcal nuclease